MRPLELELANFRSYRDARIDWRDRRLVVISGATGAGKSSLIDAICFALYGRTPEMGSTRELRELLALGAAPGGGDIDHGSVRLTFAAGAQVWRVTRRFGPEAPEPGHLLERIDPASGAALERISGRAPVDERAAGLTGLSFAAFTSAVVLAQGRFAEFLAAAPKRRDDILRELFDLPPLEGARGAALGRAAGHEREATAHERLVGELPAHDPRRRNAAAARARHAAAAVGAARAAIAILRRREAERAGADEARARAERARSLAAALPAADAARDLQARVAAAEAERAIAGQARDAAQVAAREATAARDDARASQGGDRTALIGRRTAAAELARGRAELPELIGRGAEAARRVAAEAEALATAEEALAEAERAVAQATAAHARALRRRELADGVTALEAATREAAIQRQTLADRDAERDALAAAAEAALEAGRRRHSAAELRRHLLPGDACPVCEAPVGILPGLDTPALADLSEAAAAARRTEREAAHELADARARSESATARHAEAVAALAALGGPDPEGEPATAERERTAEVERGRRLVALEERREAAHAARASAAHLDSEVVATRARTEALVGDLGVFGAARDPLAALDAALAALETVERVADAAVAVLGAAVERDERARAAAERIEREELGPIARALADLATLSEPPTVDPMDDLPGAAHRARLAAERLDESAAAGDRRAARLAVELDRLGAARLGLRALADVADVRARTQSDLTAARAARAATEEAAAAGRRLAGAARAARVQAAVFGQVAADLQANRFPRHLIQRSRRRLAAGASARLHDLSAGAYRFAMDEPDPLAVIDVRRGERRRGAATLSGGERFLASLALALGLGDVASESGGRLDCLFIDEGFSTLDADSLELALAGIERLSGAGRLIGVITHLPGVAERLGDVLRVEKDPAGISRVGDPQPS